MQSDVRMLAIYPAKGAFRVQVIDPDSQVTFRRVERAKFATLLASLNPKVFTREACGTAPY